MQFNSLDDIRAFCRDLPEGDRRVRRRRRAAAAESDKAAGQPRPARRTRDLAGAMAGPRTRPGSIASRSPCSPAITASPRAASRPIRRRSPRRWWRILPPAARPSTRSPKLAGAELRVVPIELERPTRDFTAAAAMDTDEFLAAVDIGYRTVPEDCDLLAVGEMGIANTTAAAMLCAALLGGGAARWAGRGTGVDDDGLARKRAAIEAALNFHRGILGDPLAVAAALGGRELAAIAGAVLAARRHRIPVLLDGFVATAAVLPLARLDPARSIIAAPGMSRPNPATATCCANSGSIRCSTSACGSARPPAPASRSCCCARRWPATPGWRPSPRPAFPTRTTDETLPHAPALIISRASSDEGAAHANAVIKADRCRGGAVRGDPVRRGPRFASSPVRADRSGRSSICSSGCATPANAS